MTQRSRQCAGLSTDVVNQKLSCEERRVEGQACSPVPRCTASTAAQGSARQVPAPGPGTVARCSTVWWVVAGLIPFAALIIVCGPVRLRLPCTRQLVDSRGALSQANADARRRGVLRSAVRATEWSTTLHNRHKHFPAGAADPAVPFDAGAGSKQGHHDSSRGAVAGQVDGGHDQDGRWSSHNVPHAPRQRSRPSSSRSKRWSRATSLAGSLLASRAPSPAADVAKAPPSDVQARAAAEAKAHTRAARHTRLANGAIARTLLVSHYSGAHTRPSTAEAYAVGCGAPQGREDMLAAAAAVVWADVAPPSRQQWERGIPKGMATDATGAPTVPRADPQPWWLPSRDGSGGGGSGGGSGVVPVERAPSAHELFMSPRPTPEPRSRQLSDLAASLQQALASAPQPHDHEEGGVAGDTAASGMLPAVVAATDTDTATATTRATANVEMTPREVLESSLDATALAASLHGSASGDAHPMHHRRYIGASPGIGACALPLASPRSSGEARRRVANGYDDAILRKAAVRANMVALSKTMVAANRAANPPNTHHRRPSSLMLDASGQPAAATGRAATAQPGMRPHDAQGSIPRPVNHRPSSTPGGGSNTGTGPYAGATGWGWGGHGALPDNGAVTTSAFPPPPVQTAKPHGTSRASRRTRRGSRASSATVEASPRSGEATPSTANRGGDSDAGSGCAGDSDTDDGTRYRRGSEASATDRSTSDGGWSSSSQSGSPRHLASTTPTSATSRGSPRARTSQPRRRVRGHRPRRRGQPRGRRRYRRRSGSRRGSTGSAASSGLSDGSGSATSGDADSTDLFPLSSALVDTPLHRIESGLLADSLPPGPDGDARSVASSATGRPSHSPSPSPPLSRPRSPAQPAPEDVRADTVNAVYLSPAARAARAEARASTAHSQRGTHRTRAHTAVPRAPRGVPGKSAQQLDEEWGWLRHAARRVATEEALRASHQRRKLWVVRRAPTTGGGGGVGSGHPAVDAMSRHRVAVTATPPSAQRRPRTSHATLHARGARVSVPAPRGHTAGTPRRHPSTHADAHSADVLDVVVPSAGPRDPRLFSAYLRACITQGVAPDALGMSLDPAHAPDGGRCIDLSSAGIGERGAGVIAAAVSSLGGALREALLANNVLRGGVGTQALMEALPPTRLLTLVLSHNPVGTKASFVDAVATFLRQPYCSVRHVRC